MRIALVTGGSKGLGRSLCEQLLASGYRVIEYSRTAPHPFSVHLDLSSPESVQTILTDSLADIDISDCEEVIVINNAGTIAPIGAASRKTTAEILANLNINYTSAIVFLSQIVARFQQAPCKKILANISSGAALKAYSGWSLYCAAKSGIDSFIRVLALEQHQEPHPFIPVNIDPGAIDTEMQNAICVASKADFPDIDRFRLRKNKGDLIPPEKVAAAILKILTSPRLLEGVRYDVAAYEE